MRPPGSTPRRAPAPCRAAIPGSRACPCAPRRAPAPAARRRTRGSRAGGTRGGVVVGRGGIDVVAARRLQPHDDVAEAQRRHRERPAPGRFHRERIAPRSGWLHSPMFRPGRLCERRIALGRLHEGRIAPGRLHEGRIAPGRLREGRIALGRLHEGRIALGRLHEERIALGRLHEERVALGSAPALAHRAPHRLGQGREEREVVVEIEALSDLAPGHRGVRRSRGHRLDERVAGGRDAVEPVPRGGHRAQQLDGPGRGVQSHAVADPPVAGSDSSRARLPTRRSPTGVAARSIQARARSAVNSTRSARGAYATTGHSVSASNRASALNDTARARMRPSTSGSATFIAMSRADSPCVPLAQLSSSPPASTT